MYKFFFASLLFSLFSMNSFGQTVSDKDSLPLGAKDSIRLDSKDSLQLDSLAKDQLTELSDLFSKPASYLQVGFGVGNQLYNNSIQAVNITQANRPFVLTPTVTYFHKSGFNVTANEYLLSENNSFGANQYSVAPGYETAPGSKWDLLVVYTHFFVNNTYSLYSSPVQNDYYASLVYKKHWLQPGIALGYSTGSSKEVLILDTTISGQKKRLHDSLTNNLTIFTTTFSIQHSFGWGNILSKEDSLSFIPILMLNVGSTNNNIINDDNLSTLSPVLTKAEIAAVRAKLNQKKRRLTKLENTSFNLQSLTLDLEAAYTIGNFEIEPDVYLDYYLHSSSAQNFTQTFVVNFNYSF